MMAKVLISCSAVFFAEVDAHDRVQCEKSSHEYKRKRSGIIWSKKDLLFELFISVNKMRKDFARSPREPMR